MMAPRQVDIRRCHARHLWFIEYSDVLVLRLGDPVALFRDGFRHAVPNVTGFPGERLHQNLLASHVAMELLGGPRRLDDAIRRLQRVGWLQQDLSPLVAMLADLVEREYVAERSDFLRVVINLLVWRFSVLVATGTSEQEVYEELVNVWDFAG
jgi:hypothetical protein